MVWDYESTAAISNQIFHEKFVCVCLKKHPTYSLFLAQTHGDYIAEFSTRSPYKMNKCKRYESTGHRVNGYSVGFDFNATGSLIASGSADGCVYLYNFETSKLIRRINVFNKELVSQPCMDVKFQSLSHQNEFAGSSRAYLAASSWNGAIKIFEAP